MAGLIPQPFIDELLDRVDIGEVIDSRVPLKRSGKNLKGLCPFHKEKTPSFSVNSDKQFYYCFGCGAGGNAIGFLMDYERMDFPQAVESLARLAGLEVPRESDPAQQKQRQHLPLYDWLERSCQFYQQQLRQPAARHVINYLKKRGLSGQITKRFGIGYAPPGWNHLEHALAKSEADKQHLLISGMLLKNDDSGKIYDRFRDRVMFPIRDVRGRVVAFGARVLGEEVPKYLNSPETPVFSKSRELYGLYEARQACNHLRRLLVVEGYMDVVVLAQHGIDYAVATLGTAVGGSHLERIFRYTSEVVFCFDGDNAGRAAAERALAAALPHLQDGRQVWFLFLTEGEDPDSLVGKIGKDAFEKTLGTAVPLSEFIFKLAGRDINLQTTEGRARLNKQMLPMLGQLPAGAFRQLLIAELAARTGLSVQDIVIPAQAGTTQGPTTQEITTVPAPPPMRRQALPPTRQRVEITPLRKASGLLFFNPTLASGIDEFDFLAQWEDEDAQFLNEILRYLRQSPDTSSALLIGRWMATDFRQAAEQLLRVETLLPQESTTAEFSDTMKLLAEMDCRKLYRAELTELESLGLSGMSTEQKQRYSELRGLLGSTLRRH